MIDFVTLWPVSVDYPVFRYYLPNLLSCIDNLYIHFTSSVFEENIENFIRAKTKDEKVKYIERYTNYTGEWANFAYHQFLKESESEWFGIIHQDLLIKDYDKVFSKIKEAMEYSDLIGYHFDSKEGQKLVQPVFFLCKRSSFEKTSKDFSATYTIDTCGRLSIEMENLGMKITTFDDLGLINKEDYYHMAGTTQNYRNFIYDDPFYHPINFLFYNFKNLQLPKQHPYFGQLELKIEKKFGHAPLHTFLDKFFP